MADRQATLMPSPPQPGHYARVGAIWSRWSRQKIGWMKMSNILILANKNGDTTNGMSWNYDQPKWSGDSHKFPLLFQGISDLDTSDTARDFPKKWVANSDGWMVHTPLDSWDDDHDHDPQVVRETP